MTGDLEMGRMWCFLHSQGKIATGGKKRVSKASGVLLLCSKLLGFESEVLSVGLFSVSFHLQVVLLALNSLWFHMMNDS